MALYHMVNGVNLEMTPEEEAEIKAEWATNEAYRIENGYKDQRMAAYPSVPDQLDAIWKILQATSGIAYPADALAVSEQITQVKEDYPAPIEIGTK